MGSNNTNNGLMPRDIEFGYVISNRGGCCSNSDTCCCGSAKCPSSKGYMCLLGVSFLLYGCAASMIYIFIYYLNEIMKSEFMVFAVVFIPLIICCFLGYGIATCCWSIRCSHICYC